MGPPRDRFEALFRDNARPVLAYALRRVERAEDAADVLSETMLVAWRRIDMVPPGDEARLWLFGVARHVLANQSRAEQRRTRLGSRLRRDVAAAFGDDHAETAGTRDVIRTALGALDDDDRELLRLTAWEGLAPAEVATVMDVPAATVRTRLHRARNRLRRELEALGHHLDGELVVRYAQEGS